MGGEYEIVLSSDFTFFKIKDMDQAMEIWGAAWEVRRITSIIIS